MDKPKVAGTSPIRVELEEGKTYAWCTCGLSAKQPFCDGSHRGTSFTPHKFTAEETKTRSICTCKAAAQPVFCDGSHKSLKEE
jgi:CDGSH-type Zn-finger protein